MNTDDCILFSGAARGAEAEFGAFAERHGIDEERLVRMDRPGMETAPPVFR